MISARRLSYNGPAKRVAMVWDPVVPVEWAKERDFKFGICVGVDHLGFACRISPTAACVATAVGRFYLLCRKYFAFAA